MYNRGIQPVVRCPPKNQDFIVEKCALLFRVRVYFEFGSYFCGSGSGSPDFLVIALNAVSGVKNKDIVVNITSRVQI